MKGYITIDRILFVFKNKLPKMNDPRMVMDKDKRIWITDKPEGFDKPQVIYQFDNTEEFDVWLDLIQNNQGPDESYKKIIKNRNKG